MKVSYIFLPFISAKFIQIIESEDGGNVFNDPFEGLFKGMFEGFSKMEQLMNDLDKQFSSRQLISERDEIFSDPFSQLAVGGFFQPLKQFQTADENELEIVGEPEIVDVEETQNGKTVKKHQVKEHVKDALGHKMIKNTIDEEVLGDDGQVVMHKHQTFTTGDDDGDQNSQVFSSISSSSSFQQRGDFLNGIMNALGLESNVEKEEDAVNEEIIDDSAQLDRLADTTEGDSEFVVEPDSNHVSFSSEF